MREIPGYIVVETLREGKELVLRRGKRQADQSRVLLESPVSPDGAVRARERIEREYSLQAELEPSWALAPAGLEQVQDRLSLVFEDPGGDLLSRRLHEPRSLADALKLAIGLCSALGKLHARGLVHKDLQPAHVWVDASGTVRLMGFGLASRLPRERQEPGPPEAIAGTWAYMSPEQTGRMNRSIDSRSDLYSLGVTLYELLTGALPFEAGDPLEWVHCHVARRPVPPRERNGNLPAPVSALVMKLLAKTAEDRYQTAAGVEADLKRCLEEWERRGGIEPFPLGARDFPARLQLPEKLYGRERETRLLLEAFARAEAGGVERVFVSGYSGIGKSALVQELHRALTGSRGLFAGGKFDQQRREEPYTLFIQGFQSLTDRILAGTAEDLAAWRKALQEAVGADARVLTDLIPGLGLLLGPQPEVPALSLLEARNRLHAVFSKFVGAFARPEHPLVLFLDDLQWQDSASLTLFESLATHPDLNHLLLVAAFRDAEVGPSHPLTRTLETIRAADAGMTELRLGPLTVEDLERLVADALHSPGQEVGPLAQVIHGKTGGNPFFTLQFLRYLHDDHLLGFDAERGAWTWDLERIQAQRITDNVAELVAGTLGRLPAEALEALQWIACLGAAVETALLVRILDKTEGEVHAALRPAVLAGMVIPGGGEYRILHDRIQEVAYSLIPEPRRPDMHLAIGRHLLAGLAPEAEAVAEGLFLLVDQFNRGLARIEAAAERDVVRRLNTLAGRKAMASAAYGSASVYLALARSLLPVEAWETAYPEALAILMDGAESDFMAGEENRAEALLGEILARGRSRVDRARVFLLRVRVYQAAGRYQQTVEACLEGLRTLGAAIPPADAAALGAALRESAASVKSLLEGHRVADLADAPPATGAETLVFVALTAETIGPAGLSQSPYFPLLVHEGVRVTLEQGPVAESAHLYSTFALLLSLGGDAEAGLEFSHMSLRLYERLGGIRARGALLFSQGSLVLKRRSFTDGAAILEEAVRAAERVGDVNTAGNAAVTAFWARLEAGESLEILAEAAEQYLALARRTRTKPIEQVFRRLLRFLESFRSTRDAGPFLRGREEEVMTADREEEADILAAFGRGKFNVGIAMIHIMNQISAFILGRPEEAFAHGREAERSLSPLLITSHERSHPFFQALVAAALHEGAPPERKQELAAIVAEKLVHLRKMAGLGPANYGNRLSLVEAEVARIEDRDLEAMRLYEQAIRSARERGIVHHESIASETAARFYRTRGFETIAQAYFRNARAGYLRWGATGKVKQIDRLLPGLEAPRASVDAGLGVSPEDLDLMAVVKASQAVSGEIVLERFLDRLLRIMLESAGAERGALLRPLEEGLVVEAEAEVRGEGIAVRMAEEAVSPERFPASMLRFVSRTRERVLLDDAAAPGPYAEDPYVQARRPRSVLVLPLVKQSTLVAVLYLENRLAPRAFTPGQAAVAQLLASQAAVSLENARLYRNLQRAEERFAKAFRDSPSPMAIVRRKDEVLLDANARFLATYGYSREELLGRSLRELDLIVPEEAERLDSLLSAQGFLRDVEVSARNRDGKTLSLLASLEPIDLDGEACALVTHVDITGRKQMETQLRQSQKMEAIGRLAGGVAHDFNNLLTVINGFSGMALEGLDASLPYHGFILEILKAGERAAALTRQLLAHSRMQVQETKPWNLNVIVEDVVPMLRRLIGEDILLETELAPDLGLARLDRGQVEQILLNLVVNARDAISGNGKIGIRTANVRLDQAYLEDHLEAAVGPHVMLSVSDTGSGMTPEVKARLFEPFFTTKPVGKGTGLGLSVVYGIVKQSGGNISVYSEPGMGTVFRVYFHEVAPSEGGARTREAVPDPASFRGHEAVLLVEDAVPVRRFAALALEAQGYAVAEAGNGVEALQVLGSRPDIRIVLTDVVMPDMGGAALAGRLRTLRPSLPIVFMSGFVEHTEVRDILAQFGERMLQKPFTPYDLARAVRETLDASAKNPE